MVVRTGVRGRRLSRRLRVRIQWPGVRTYGLAALAVLPLLVPELWVGFRLGLSEPALGVIAPTEQQLSVRSPVGLWAGALALAWFGLTYRRREVVLWEAALVVIGGYVALVRLGNAWVDAAAILVPLARQLALARLKPVVMGGLAAICLAVALVTLAISRPPDLPTAASEAALSSAPHGTVMADWRWAGELQHRLGPFRPVWASEGLASEAADFWLEYVRVAKGHVRWAEILGEMQVDLLVLDAAGQQHQAAELVRASPDWHVTFDADGVLVAERASR